MILHLYTVYSLVLFSCIVQILNFFLVVYIEVMKLVSFVKCYLNALYVFIFDFVLYVCTLKFLKIEMTYPRNVPKHFCSFYQQTKLL